MLRPGDPFNAFLDYPETAVPHAASGPLAGLTLGVKDIFDVARYVSGWGNAQRMAEAAPATRTAPAVQELLDSGARFVGKTQTEEMAFSLTGQNSHFPFPVNPAAKDRVTGGSSSGSAAAVAGGLCDIATGSDTGGSIRAPASYCGLVGLRTTHGDIPLAGTLPLAASLDTFGWFAKDIGTYETVTRLYFAETRRPPFRPLHVAELDELVLGEEEAAEYGRMVDLVAEILGEPSPAPPLRQSVDDLYWCFRKQQAKEAWVTHGHWIKSKDRGLDPVIRSRFEFGQTISLAEALEDGKRRKSFRAELADLLGDDGVIVLPTVPGAAPLAKSTPDEFQAYRERALRLLCWSGLSGFPQITLPLGTVRGAPFGISLLGPVGSDLALVQAGRAILENAEA